MLRIKTPATTSNLGVGFDCLGMALNIYNVFEFRKSVKYQIEGFPTEHKTDNLVKKVYVDICKHYKVSDIKKVNIKLVKNDIPIARGLGSSASCIVAGALAANHFNKLNLSLPQIAKYCANYEGHPDNVFACLYGGLVSVSKTDDSYIFDQFEVSKNFQFALLIPNISGSTESLRNILPKTISLDDAVHNLSRIIHLPKAFKSGNLDTLSEVVKDKYHEEFRANFIPKYKEIKKLSEANNIVTLISGSGPTLFLLSNENNFNYYQAYQDRFRLVNVLISEGTTKEIIL